MRDVGDEWTNPLSGLGYIWNGKSWDRIDQTQTKAPEIIEPSSLFDADDDIPFD